MKLRVVWLACKSVQDETIDNVDSIEFDKFFMKVYKSLGLYRKYKVDSIIKYHLY